MKSESKKLGIWMDHTAAHLMEFTQDPIKTTTINSKFTHQVKEHSLSRSENLMHNKEQHQQNAYYKKLGDVIKNYGEILLFGPTEAKMELSNMLKADHNFKDTKIKIEQTDKMTENQQHAYVKNHFSKTNLY
jgi:ADP-heptose:LPS heptosyltransferase